MWLRRGFCWILLILALAACGRGGSQPALVHDSKVPTVLSADWLRLQPGRSLDNLTFHLLDSNQEPISDWRGITIAAESGPGQTYSIALGDLAPDDVYLYVTYPMDRLALDQYELLEGYTGEYIMLCVPHRIEDVLIIGLARIGSRRGVSAVPGTVAEFSFAEGSDRLYRSASRVNEDPTSVVELQVAQTTEENVTLQWTERNIGDYNNNSQVEIADITPLGIHLGERVADSETPKELEVIDGSLDGELNISDLTPIGRNFSRYIQGYVVYHATGDDPQPSDFAPAGVPTVDRSVYWETLTGQQRRERVVYTYQAAAELGANHYFVTAYSGDGGSVSEGPASNTVTAQVSAVNLRPQWYSTEGLVTAAGWGDGIQCTFGEAFDPDGVTTDSVSYVIYYNEGAGDIGSPGTIEELIPVGMTSGEPPYVYHLEGLTRGEDYRLLLVARDADGYITDNTATQVVTVPFLSTSTDTWPSVRHDPAGTGTNPTAAPHEPFVLDWEYDLSWPTTSNRPLNSPVISSDGWIGALNADGNFIRLNLESGNIIGGNSGLGEAVRWLPSLDGGTLIGGTTQGLAVFDVSTPANAVEYAVGDVEAAPLLMGSYAFIARRDGSVSAVLWSNGVEEWTWTDPEVDPPSAIPFTVTPVADAGHLYVVNDVGTVYKLGLLTGEEVERGSLGATPVGGSVCLDTLNGRLYAVTTDTLLVELDTMKLEKARTWTRLPIERTATGPCLVAGADPPIVVVGTIYNAMLEGPDKVIALNIGTGGRAWEQEVDDLVWPAAVTASSDRIFVGCWGRSYVFNFAGSIRQTIPAASISDMVIGGDRIACVNKDRLQVFRRATEAEDGPPVWQDMVGIGELTNGDGSISVHWMWAEDDHMMPVYYAIFYSTAGPPSFEPPYEFTNLITDIPAGGENHLNRQYLHHYTIEGLENGMRYYVGVRAYDRPWDESPNIDPNTNWLATTPPWQQNEIEIDTGVWEPKYIRGLTDPTGDLHLVFNDRNNGSLRHLWGATGIENSESENLGPYISAVFDVSWGDDLLIGWSDTTIAGMLARTGPDTWANTLVPGAILPVNPMLAVAGGGGEGALAFTQFVAPHAPLQEEEHYYIMQTDTGVWQSPVVLDDQNFSGRDLDTVINPADATDTWIAMQRGGTYAPNRTTPMDGELVFARSDGAGGFTLETVDAGENTPDSDCGKRVTMAVDVNGEPHLAYLDLNASADNPVGQLKYAKAEIDGISGEWTWTVETVSQFDLSFQPASNQFTYGEISLALLNGEQPLIGTLHRTSYASSNGMPHSVEAEVWVRDGPADWRLEKLTDDESVVIDFPRDRESCVLLARPDGSVHMYFTRVSDPEEEVVSDRLVHLWRDME